MYKRNIEYREKGKETNKKIKINAERGKNLCLPRVKRQKQESIIAVLQRNYEEKSKEKVWSYDNGNNTYS